MRTTCGGLRQCLPLLSFSLFHLLLNTMVAFGQAQPQVVQAVDNARRVTLTGNTHPLARAEFDSGAADDALPMTRILLLLKRTDEQESALQQLMDQQQDKGSPNYHAWLTPEQFGSLYGPADADIQAVTQWLGSQEFRIEKVYGGKTVIEFSGTAGQVRNAFGAAMRNYQVNGNKYVANANDPQIPAALAPVVAGILSLNSFPRQSHSRLLGHATKIPERPGWQPEFTFPNPFGGSGNFYAMAPGDFATIYNSKGLISSGNDGTGQVIAIVGETNINVSDVQAFRTLFGLPSTFTSSNVIVNGEDPGITSVGEEGEADLDTQWAGAVAPGATVKLVVSASTSSSAGIDLSALYIIEHNLAGVMSESYGTCEAALGAAGNAFYKSLWEQAAAQGITAIVSSGDNGSAGCDDFTTATTASQGLAVSGVASTPFNVAVGGTDFDEVNKWSTYWSATNATSGTDMIGTSALGYIPEIPWNQNCAQIGLTGCANNPPTGSVNIVAGSGGFSTLYTKPGWQMGVTGVPNDNHRDVPDVSLFASTGFDGSGYIICQADAYANLPCSIITPGGVNVQIIGGTSASAPAFAGVMALVNQYQSTHGGINRQGNANYYFYALARKAGASCTSSAVEAAGCIFNDIVKGNSVLPNGMAGVATNSVPCKGGSPDCSAALAGQTGVLVETASATTEAWTATAGYDLVTGLGSVNIANLATNWNTVNTVSTATTLTLAPTNVTHGSAENVSVNIGVVPKSGTVTGDVALIAKLSDGTTQGVDQFTLSGGTVSTTTNSLPGGTNYEVYAHYAGDGTNAPSDSPPVTVSVSPESSKTFANLATFDNSGNLISYTASSATYGSGFAVFRVDVGDSGASVSPTAGISSNCSKRLTTCPTGAASITSTGSSLGTSSLALNSLGYGETAPLPPGTYSITANYPGDASYGASTSSANFVIAKAPTTVTAAVAGTPVQLGNFTQIVASLGTTSDGDAPTGTFQFFVDGNALGNPVPVYESGPYTPTMSPPYAWADASSSTSFMSVGSHTLSAQYSGDNNYAASTSPNAVVNVTKALPSVTEYQASPNSINLGQSTTLITQVVGTVASLPPTGTVTFSDGTTTISGLVTYSTNQATLQATLPYTPATVGTHQINFAYSGDSDYLAGTSPTSATLTVVGPDFTVSPQPGSVTVKAGSPATYAVTVAGSDGFSSNVNVSCSLAAAATTCSAYPASVSPGSSTTITVTTTAHQAVAFLPSAKPPGPGVWLWVIAALSASVLLLLSRSKFAIQTEFVRCAAVLALLMGALLEAACGGGGGGSSVGPPPQFGTQAGTYVVAVTATAGTTTHTTTVTLTVQ